LQAHVRCVPQQAAHVCEAFLQSFKVQRYFDKLFLHALSWFPIKESEIFFSVTLQNVTVDLNFSLCVLFLYCIMQNPPSRLENSSTRISLTLLARELARLTVAFLVVLYHSRLVLGQYTHYHKTSSFHIMYCSLSHEPFIQYRTRLNESQVPGHHGTWIMCRGA
jgi:hypothetical protein